MLYSIYHFFYHFTRPEFCNANLTLMNQNVTTLRYHSANDFHGVEPLIKCNKELITNNNWEFV